MYDANTVTYWSFKYLRFGGGFGDYDVAYVGGFVGRVVAASRAICGGGKGDCEVGGGGPEADVIVGGSDFDFG